MATPITVSIPHQLGRAEARRRIETGFAKIVHQLPGSGGTCSERWDGDRLIFGVAAMGQTVAGVVDVLDAAVTMEIELPGVLGMIAGGLKDRLQKAGQLLLTKEYDRRSPVLAFPAGRRRGPLSFPQPSVVRAGSSRGKTSAKASKRFHFGIGGV